MMIHILKLENICLLVQSYSPIIYYVNPPVLSLTYFKDYTGGVVRFNIDMNVFIPLSSPVNPQ